MKEIEVTWGVAIHKIIRNKTLNRLNNLIPILYKVLDRLPEKMRGKVFYDTYTVTERIFEKGFTFMHLKEEEKILDIGCHHSTLSFELASLGFKVWGIDIKNYPFYHPNLTFIRCDATNLPFMDNFFDVVIAISTIEHIGLGHYGDPVYKSGDKDAIDEIYRVLRPGGKFIITIPYGRKMVVQRIFRIYDHASIYSLLSQFEIKNEEYFLKENEFWRPAIEQEVRDKTVGKRNENLATITIVAIKK